MGDFMAAKPGGTGTASLTSEGAAVVNLREQH